MNGDASVRIEAPARAQAASLRPGNGFDSAVAGIPATLRTSDGRHRRLTVRRWHGAAAGWDLWLLARCSGPTLDLGCGPGRLVRWLLDHGIPALGVDSSPHAGVVCDPRHASVLHGDVFDPIPEEGRWAHVLLADGNIGIGGDPVALLVRCAALLAPGGSVLVELEPPGTGLWTGYARVESGPDTAEIPRGPWFRWAAVGLDAFDELAARAGLRVVDRRAGRRSFAQLRRVAEVGL